jgi:glycosyltransferase involved in cell wall biosynthesis
MRVLILSRRLGPEWSADAERLRALERWITKAGYDSLIVPSENHDTGARDRGIWPAVMQATRMAYQARTLGPVRLVVVAGCDPSLLLAARLCRAWRGWPFVIDADATHSPDVSEADPLGRSYRWFRDWARRRSFAEAAAIVTTRDTAIEESIASERAGIASSASRTVSVRHAVDLNEWRPATHSKPFRSLWNCRDRFVCGAPGGPVASTHAQMLLTAAEQLSSQRRDDFQFWVVPEGESSVAWEQIVARRRLGNVRVVGRPPRATLPSLVASCNAWLCSPTQVAGPQLRTDILSILALGVPVLAPARGSIVDQILDADAGLGVVPGSSESLLDGLEELRQFPEACRGGRPYVAERNDAEHVAADWERLMRDVGLPVRLPLWQQPAAVRPAIAWGERDAA